MKVRDVAELLDCEILLGDDGRLEREVKTACGSDMMSDVLAYVKDQSVLLTGLVNAQVVRTADMMDMLCIVFVRGKTPPEDTVEMAAEHGIALLSTNFGMFESCGRLYKAGLQGGEWTR